MRPSLHARTALQGLQATMESVGSALGERNPLARDGLATAATQEQLAKTDYALLARLEKVQTVAQRCACRALEDSSRLPAPAI